jgi:hypothetical protein
MRRIACVAAFFGIVALASRADPEKPAKPPLGVQGVARQPEGKAAPAGSRNLLPNGDFEAGDRTPANWQTVDGLCSFWVKDADPKHGKVLKFDTDVYQSQAYPWWVKIAGGASPADAPKKTPTTGEKYDTIAGNDGVWFWSDYVPVQEGKAYWLTVDVKGPGLLVWLVGYPEKGSTAFGSENGAFMEVLKESQIGRPKEMKRGHEAFIHKYVWKGQLAAGGSDTWKTYSRRQQPFRPTVSAGRPNGVKWVRVLLFPFWPPGEYYVDNVCLTEWAERGDTKGVGRE